MLSKDDSSPNKVTFRETNLISLSLLIMGKGFGCLAAEWSRSLVVSGLVAHTLTLIQARTVVLNQTKHLAGSSASNMKLLVIC